MLPNRGIGLASGLRVQRLAPQSLRQVCRPMEARRASASPSSRQFGTAQRRHEPRSHGLLRHGTSRPSVLRGALPLAAVTAASQQQAMALSLWPFGGGSKAPKEHPPAGTESTTAAAPEAPLVDTTPVTTDVVVASSTSTAPSPSSWAASDVAANEEILAALNTQAATGLDKAVLGPDQLGYLSSLGLDFGWGPTSLVQWTIEHMHYYMGGPPWWVTLGVFALLLRAALLRPSIKSAANSAKMQEVYNTPVAKELQARMKESFAKGDSQDGLQANAQLRALLKARGAGGLGTMLAGLAPAVVSIPIFFSTYKLLEAMSRLPVPELQHGGMLWFPDLTVADPTFALPVMTAALTFFMISWTLRTLPDQTQGVMKLMMYGLGPLGLYLTASLPAGLQFYFLVTGLGAMVQTALMTNPTTRKRLGLPDLPKPSSPAGGAAKAVATSRSSPWMGGAKAAVAPTPPASGAQKVIPTSATVTSAASTTPAPSASSPTYNPLDHVKKAWDQASGKAEQHLRKNQTKDSLKKSREYEAKRAEEDRLNFEKRRNEALRRK